MPNNLRFASHFPEHDDIEENELKALSYRTNNFATMEIISGGLERLGPRSYAGKGFYIGFIWSTTLVYAVQGDFGLFEGYAYASHASHYDITMVYSRTEDSVQLYRDGALVSTATKIHNVTCKPLPPTFGDYLVFGSRYSYIKRHTGGYFSNVKFWRHPLNFEDLKQTYSKCKHSLQKIQTQTHG